MTDLKTMIDFELLVSIFLHLETLYAFIHLGICRFIDSASKRLSANFLNLVISIWID